MVTERAQIMEDLEGLQRSLNKERKKMPVYADILTELKRRSLEENDFPSSVPLAPMQPGLRPATHLTSEIKSISRAKKAKSESTLLSPAAINELSQKSLKESSKRLKAIEDHMWQHRQEERDLKRAEADIVRQQKQMEKNIKQYKNKISKFKTEETQNFYEKESAFADFYNSDLHTREKLTKEKIQYGSTANQRMNEETKRFMKSVNELSFRYKTLMEILEKKRSEMEKLSSEFEARIREKEDEQHEVKKELASLAIKLNMEAQKRRHQVVDNKREKSRLAIKDTVAANSRESVVRQKQAAIHHTGAIHDHHQLKLDRTAQSREEAIRNKQVQEGRNLADVLTQAKHKSELQRFTQQEAEFTHLDILNEEIQKSVDIANAKRRNRLESFQQQVKNRNATEHQTWAQRALALENEAKKRERYERVKKLSKIVAHQDEVEHSLYTTAKNAESLRKKQTQTVEKMYLDLKSLKIQNAKKLKEAAVEAQKTEQQLQQKIARELGELSKAVNTREESLRSLAVQRGRAREERRMLDEEKREYDRKDKISKQTTHSNSIL